jgi:hypothetical protein
MLNYTKNLTAMYKDNPLPRNSKFLVFITCVNPAHTMMAKKAKSIVPISYNTALHGGECHTCSNPGR